MLERIGREMGATFRKAEQVLSQYERIQAEYQQLQQRELSLQKKISFMRRIVGAITFLFLLSNICWFMFIILNYSQN